MVALRNLRNASGRADRRTGVVRAAARRSAAAAAASASQRGRYARIFTALETSGDRAAAACTRRGTSRSASPQSLTWRLLAIRNDAFAQLGDHDLADGDRAGPRPAFTVTSTDQPDAATLLDVQGTFKMPCYLITCGPTATTRLSLQLAQSRRTADADPGQRGHGAV